MPPLIFVFEGAAARTSAFRFTKKETEHSQRTVTFLRQSFHFTASSYDLT